MRSRKAWEGVVGSPDQRKRSPKAPAGVKVAKRPAKGRYDGFVGLCRAAGLPEPVSELVFAPPRRFRFDFAWPDARLALEIDGGLFSGGGHVRGAHILTTHEKMNLAAVAGWRVLYTTPRQLAGMLETIRAALLR